MREFESPARSLGDLSPEVVGRLLAASADVALVIDDEGAHHRGTVTVTQV